MSKIWFVLLLILMLLSLMGSPVVARNCKNNGRYGTCVTPTPTPTPVSYYTAEQINIQWCQFGANGIWACRGTLVGDTSGTIYWFKEATITLSDGTSVVVYYKL